MPRGCRVGTFGWDSKGAQQPFGQGRGPCPARECERARRPKVVEPRVDFPEVDKKRISSTNGQERLNMEIRRRSRVVGVFPSVESYVRLTICYLVEYSEDWGSERSYIREDKVLGFLDRLHELMAQAAN